MELLCVNMLHAVPYLAAVCFSYCFLHTAMSGRKPEGGQAEKHQLYSAVGCDEDGFFFHSQRLASFSRWARLGSDMLVLQITFFTLSSGIVNVNVIAE